MKCVIECRQPLKNKYQIITLKNDKIYVDDGMYEKVVLDDCDVVCKIYDKLCKIAFYWKQEYIGERVYDGEKYLIEFEINHKKKKYKIQNKFPENWEEFLLIKEKILGLEEV